jgi:ATP-GRASP peptide maturase of grasp-with-spasm system
MILIISSEDDKSTNDVINWLLRYQQKFLRISQKNKITILEAAINSKNTGLRFSIDGKEYSDSDFKWIWYRRSNYGFTQFSYDQTPDNQLNKEITDQLFSELNVLSDFFISRMDSISINSPNDLNLNKLKALKLCAEFDISIPESIVTSEKKTLQIFKEKKNKIITKNISQGVFVSYDHQFLNGYTIEVTDELIEKLDHHFFPTLFQEMIEKAFEVRVFFIEDVFYSCAILSQNDNKTKLDFRNYNTSKPNRNSPFEIPVEIKLKLKKLMKALNLNSGSVDMIITKKGNYVFLEVNPIGQFSQFSKPCNYQLEKVIAEYLVKK